MLFEKWRGGWRSWWWSVSRSKVGLVVGRRESGGERSVSCGWRRRWWGSGNLICGL